MADGAMWQVGTIITIHAQHLRISQVLLSSQSAYIEASTNFKDMFPGPLVERRSSLMSWRFCGDCGLAVVWHQGADGGLLTKQRCSGCGCDIYRNPAVYILCFVSQRNSALIDMTGGLLTQSAVIENPVQLLSEYCLAADGDAQLRILGVVTDFDKDRVFLLFHTRKCNPAASRLADIGFDPWTTELSSRLLEDLEDGQHRAYAGIVLDGKLHLVSEN